MPEYQNTKRMPVPMEFPGRTVSIPGYGRLNVSQVEENCENLKRAVAKGLLKKVKEKASSAPILAPVPTPPIPSIRPALAPKPSFPVSPPPPPAEEEKLSFDSPGQPAGNAVAPSDDQAPDEGVSDKPGEGATKPRSRSRRRSKK